MKNKQDIIHVMFAFCLCTCVVAIIGSLCFRVIQDGNDMMSQSIATNLTQLGIICVIGLLGVFGINKIGAGTNIPTPTNQSSQLPPSDSSI
jgi:hypothetical protein